MPVPDSISYSRFTRVMSPNDPTLVEILTHGELTIEHRMPHSSNGTFMATVVFNDTSCRAIYKPMANERPLWDFEPGLHRREVAAFLLSECMNLNLIPTTVLRDGPLGEGSVQFYIHNNAAEHYFTLYESRPDLHDRFREFVVFDLIANNTDRKSGHIVLADADNNAWGIDHGVCFSADFKLRTVIWEFGGEEVPPHLREAATSLSQSVPLQIAALLSDDEISALQERAEWVAEQERFPVNRSGHFYPWPLV
jgi:uncharacterized repeat protein (TIGR03843 family)